MGFFSWIGSKVEKVKEKASRVVNTVKEKAYEVGRAVKEKASNMWGTISGKKIAEEAKAMYRKARELYEGEKLRYEKEVEIKTKAINEKIEKINAYKQKAFTKYVKEYIDIASKITSFNLESEATLEKEFKLATRELKMKSESSVMKIDFDRNRFKANLMAVFTLGFKTRKLAKESLEEANKVRVSVNQEIAEMNGELKRLEMINKAIGNVVVYLEGIMEVMDKLLPKLNNSFKTLRNLHLIFSYSIVKGKLDHNKLPKVQLAYFEAASNFSKILIELSKKKYINENYTVIQEDINEAEKIYNDSKDAREAA